MIVNKMCKKPLQTNQEEEITDYRKSKMEKHWVKPQILDHSYKFLTSFWYSFIYNALKGSTVVLERLLGFERTMGGLFFCVDGCMREDS